MNNFLILLLECSISMTAIGLLYMAATPFLRGRFTAKGSYYAWLVMVIGFIVPFRFHLPVSMISVDTLFPAMANAYPSTFSSTSAVFPETVNAAVFPLHLVALAVWLTGVVLFVTCQIIRHRRLLRLVKRWSEEAANRQALHLLQGMQAELNINRHVDLRICPTIPCPMLVGLLHPVILLPSDRLSVQELQFIQKHELIHLKRGDLGWKGLVFAATALHWFNPFVYRMAREIALQCELSCDEAVIMHSEISDRQQYAETIIGVVKNPSGGRSLFSTSFSDSKLSLKKRVFSIMDTRGKKWGLSLLIVTAIAVIGTGAVLQLNPTQSETAMSQSSNPVLDNGIGTNRNEREPGVSPSDSPVAVVSPIASASTTGESSTKEEPRGEGAALQAGTSDANQSKSTPSEFFAATFNSEQLKSDSASGGAVLKEDTTRFMFDEIQSDKK